MFDSNPNIQYKVIVPKNTASHTRTTDALDVQSQRQEFASLDHLVLSPDQTDQLGGATPSQRFYAIFKKKRINTQIKNKKGAIQDLVKKIFKLNKGESTVKFTLYEKQKGGKKMTKDSKKQKGGMKKHTTERFYAFMNPQSKKYKYRVQQI